MNLAILYSQIDIIQTLLLAPTEVFWEIMMDRSVFLIVPYTIKASITALHKTTE